MPLLFCAQHADQRDWRQGSICALTRRSPFGVSSQQGVRRALHSAGGVGCPCPHQRPPYEDQSLEPRWRGTRSLHCMQRRVWFTPMPLCGEVTGVLSHRSRFGHFGHAGWAISVHLGEVGPDVSSTCSTVGSDPCCGRSALLFFLRGCQKQLSLVDWQYATKRDARCGDVSGCILGVTDATTPVTAKVISSLLVSEGGLGLLCAVRLRAAAHWVSWADCLHMVKVRHPRISGMIVRAMTTGDRPTTI